MASSSNEPDWTLTPDIRTRLNQHSRLLFLPMKKLFPDGNKAPARRLFVMSARTAGDHEFGSGRSDGKSFRSQDGALRQTRTTCRVNPFSDRAFHFSRGIRLR